MLVAVDIGGTRIKYGVADGPCFLDGYPCWFPTPSRNLIPTLCAKLERLTINFPVDAVVISIAANVDRNGRVLHATNLPLEQGVDLASVVERQCRAPVTVENDGNCAALAVAAMQQFKSMDPLVAVVLGTGVGGGIIVEGKPLRGTLGCGAEIGHLVIDDKGPRCGCGKWGCVEAFAGEPGILQRFNEQSHEPIASGLELAERLRDGDRLAASIVADTGHFLGKAMALISDIIAPRVFVLAGGLAGLGRPLLDPARDVLKKRSFLRHVDQVPDVMSVDDDPYLVLRGALELRNR